MRGAGVSEWARPRRCAQDALSLPPTVEALQNGRSGIAHILVHSCIQKPEMRCASPPERFRRSGSSATAALVTDGAARHVLAGLQRGPEPPEHGIKRTPTGTAVAAVGQPAA